MSALKPGKIGLIPGAKTNAGIKRKQTQVKQREVWDDFSPAKTNKKKEYRKGAGNRMIPDTSSRDDKRGLDLKERPEGGEESEKYEPRTDYEALEARLGIEFSDRSLLSRALTHRSALGLKERADYERLEFLGDAVLDLSVAHLLSDLHPEAREGELSKMRAALVNTQALAQIALELEIGPYIRLGRGELSSGGAERPSILADVMEALIGAVYRDSSYEVALNMIRDIFGTSLEEVTPFDPKTELQEALHAAGSEPPNYLLELVEGPEHAPTFVTVVIVDGEVAGRGRGTTKKAAQQQAAAEALTKLIPDAPRVELAKNQNAFIAGGLLIPPVQSNGATSEQANAVEENASESDEQEQESAASEASA